MLKHNHNKDSHFIPSPYKVVTSYENAFIRDWSESVANGVGEVIKYIAKITAEETNKK